MSNLDFIDKSELLKVILSILQYEKNRITPSLFAQFDSLRKQIEGDGFHNKMIRFVKNDFLYDYFKQDAEKYSEDWVNQNLNELPKEVILNPSLLDNEYEWLASDKAKRADKFGKIGENARQALRVMCALELPALINPTTKLEIRAHTDSKGPKIDPEQYNRRLSISRARNTKQAIKDILGKKLENIPPKNFTAEGFGWDEAVKAGERL
jgi:hypothetical protein